MKAAKPPRPKLFPYPLGHSGQGWHAIAALVECPKEYQLKTVRGIGKGGEFMPDHFALGSLLHAARAQWLYDNRKGLLWKEAIRDYYERATKAGDRIRPELVNQAMTDFGGFVKYWSVRPTTQVLAIEHLLNPRGFYPNAPAWVHRTARLDSVETWKGKVWIGECKSTSGSAAKIADVYALNGQLLLQMALWSEEEDKQFGKLAGVLIDPIIKGRGGKPGTGAPRIAIPVERVKHALESFKRDFPTWVMLASTVNWNDRVERRVTACMRTFGACEYRELCSAGRLGSSRYEFKDGSPIIMWESEAGKEVPPWD
jgi:hypothetical protein